MTVLEIASFGIAFVGLIVAIVTLVTADKGNKPLRYFVGLASILVAIYFGFMGFTSIQVGPPSTTPVPTPAKAYSSQPAPANTTLPIPSPPSILENNASTSSSRYDASVWNCNNCEAGNVSNENGAVRLELSGVDQALNLSSRVSWPSSQIGNIAGKLRLMKDEKNSSGTVDLSLHTTLASKLWQAGCSITPSQFASTQAEYSCEIFTVDPQRQWKYEYTTPATVLGYGEWHTVKIELVPDTLEIRFYLDDRFIGQHSPADKDELKDKDMTSQIGIYTYGGKFSHIVAYANDVLMTPIR